MGAQQHCAHAEVALDTALSSCMSSRRRVQGAKRGSLGSSTKDRVRVMVRMTTGLGLCMIVTRLRLTIVVIPLLMMRANRHPVTNYHAAVYVYAVHSHASTIIIHTRQPTTKPTPPIPKEIYSFGEGENSASRFRSVSSASLSILEMSSLQVGMSWIRPMTWPAVQTPCSGSPLMKTSRPRLPLT